MFKKWIMSKIFDEFVHISDYKDLEKRVEEDKRTLLIINSLVIKHNEILVDVVKTQNELVLTILENSITGESADRVFNFASEDDDLIN